MNKELDILKFDYTHEQVIENHMGGVLYNFFEKREFKSIWKRQWFHNDLLKSEFERLGPIFKEKSIRPVVVKGVALLYGPYSDMGSRNMSDCDLLVSPSEFLDVCDLLVCEGYQIMKTSKWFANDFKCELSKVVNGREINFEIHSKLLFHHDYENWNKTKLTEHYDTLGNEDHLIYMCAHLAFSHSFLKLYWLFDIYLIALRENLTYEKLKKRAMELRVLNSLKMCFFCLNKFFFIEKVLTPSSKIYDRLFTLEFLWSAKQSGLSYFLIKHLSKDSLLMSFKYDVFWFLNKISQIFLQRGS